MQVELGKLRHRLAQGLRVLLLVLVAWGTAGAEVRPLAELRSNLGQTDGNERRKAAAALGAHHTPEAVALLLDTYRAETQDAFGVRAACAEALGDTGQSTAVAALEEILGDADYWVRRQAANALGRLPGAAVLAALDAAARDRDPRVRVAAVLALGGREGSGDLLLRAHRDPEPTVGAAALEALAVSQHPLAAGLLERALTEAPWQMRYRAAALLARAGDPRGLAELAAAARSGHHAGAALRETVGVGDPAVATLAALYRGGDGELATRVLDILEEMEGGESTAFFAALAADPEAPAADRARAIAVLFDRREVLTAAQVAGVAGLLDAGDDNLTAVSLQILLERGDSGYLQRVVPLVHHANKVVRHFALFNLRRHGGAPYESSFVEALEDANGANVRLALEALGESGSSASLPAIRAFAEERKYRRYALEAVEGIEARSR